MGWACRAGLSGARLGLQCPLGLARNLLRASFLAAFFYTILHTLLHSMFFLFFPPGGIPRKGLGSCILSSPFFPFLFFSFSCPSLTCWKNTNGGGGVRATSFLHTRLVLICLHSSSFRLLLLLSLSRLFRPISSLFPGQKGAGARAPAPQHKRLLHSTTNASTGIRSCQLSTPYTTYRVHRYLIPLRYTTLVYITLV